MYGEERMGTRPRTGGVHRCLRHGTKLIDIDLAMLLSDCGIPISNAKLNYVYSSTLEGSIFNINL